jgi:hypothetical protein
MQFENLVRSILDAPTAVSKQPSSPGIASIGLPHLPIAVHPAIAQEEQRRTLKIPSFLLTRKFLRTIVKADFFVKPYGIGMLRS